MAVNKVVRSDGTTLIDISDTTAVASDVAQGKYFYNASGVKTAGTASGGPSVTRHTIYLEFTDETSTTIYAYYDSLFVGNAITSTTPTTYDNKTVTSAQLDGVEWYSYTPTEWETLGEGTYTPYTDYGEYFWIPNLASAVPVAGEEWRISIDGIPYVCTAKMVYHGPDGSRVVVGNPLYYSGDDDGSDVPFCFYNYNKQAFCGDTLLPVKEYVVKIERKISE